ncbi:MAG: hypothetical protein BZ133_07640 [Methanosphaera sp. SHI613]|jgi:hypothetical protein|nr:MAG: hypothetical protein BZ133_07640 [Methanosphaera sp. SHI613]
MTFSEVILGCSPFTLGYQFGHRSRLYELDFSGYPENIVEVIDKAYEMNVKDIMFKVNKDLEKAIDISTQNGNEWTVTAFTDCENIDDDLELFSKFNTKRVILSGEFIDKKIEESDYDTISDYLARISDASFIPSIETRQPFKNVPIIKNSSFIDEFDTIMIPLNFYGYMMDCNFFNSENRDVFADMISSLNKEVIANRTLATGILQPQEAYDFLKNIDYIDAVCVAVAKSSEAEETFSIINEIM